MIEKHVNTFLESLINVLAQSWKKPFKLSGVSFRLADLRCKSNNVLSEISFPAETKVGHPKVLEKFSQVSIPQLVIDERKCASAVRVTGLADIESFINDTRSAVVGPKLISFFTKNSRFPKKIDTMLENTMKKVGERISWDGPEIHVESSNISHKD